MKRQKKDGTIEITGLVIPARWDGDNNVIGVKISTGGEKEFFVTDEGKGSELLGLLGMKVKARGAVTDDGKPEAPITVTWYALVLE